MAVATRMTTMSHRAAQASTQILQVSVVMFGLACTNNQRPVPPEPTPGWLTPHAPWRGARPAAPVRLRNPLEARYHMRMHFGDLQIVEQALITGKLAEGLSVAYLLTRPSDDPGLAKWAAQSSRVHAAALALTRAQDVDEALRRLAR